MLLTCAILNRHMGFMKVLFITSTRLGDAILSTGLLDYLLTEYPKAKVTVACGPLPQSIFEGYLNVERIIAMKKEKNHGHWIKLWKQTIGIKWDMVIDLRDSAVSRLIWGDQKYIFGQHIDKTKHKVEQAAEVMSLSHVPAPMLYFTNEQKQFAENLIPPHPMGEREERSEGEGGKNKIIAIGPSANWIGKTWAPENFIEVIKWLTAPSGKFPHARVAVFAAPGEEAQAQPVLDSVPIERQINGIAKGNPAEVAAAIARCDFYIGNDSGLMHAAAAAGVPTVGLFGPSYPHLYAPWGDHTTYAQTPETFDELINFDGYNPKTLGHSLMKSLTLGTVKEKISNFYG